MKYLSLILLFLSCNASNITGNEKNDEIGFTWKASKFFAENQKDYTVLNAFLVKGNNKTVEIVKFRKNSKLNSLPHALAWRTRYLIISNKKEYLLNLNDILYSIFQHQDKFHFIIGSEDGNSCIRIDEKGFSNLSLKSVPVGYSYSNFQDKKESKVIPMKGLIKKGELSTKLLPSRIKIVHSESYINKVK